jgi:DNA-directed RNA polymerase subunit RPC12/RpoP
MKTIQCYKCGSGITLDNADDDYRCNSCGAVLMKPTTNAQNTPLAAAELAEIEQRVKAFDYYDDTPADTAQAMCDDVSRLLATVRALQAERDRARLKQALAIKAAEYWKHQATSFEQPDADADRIAALEARVAALECALLLSAKDV